MGKREVVKWERKWRKCIFYLIKVCFYWCKLEINGKKKRGEEGGFLIPTNLVGKAKTLEAQGV